MTLLSDLFLWRLRILGKIGDSSEKVYKMDRLESSGDADVTVVVQSGSATNCCTKTQRQRGLAGSDVRARACNCPSDPAAQRGSIGADLRLHANSI